MGLFGKQMKKQAKSAKLMGVRTAVDSEVHLLGQVDVNYTVYSFFVEYVDGTSGSEEVAAQRPRGSSEEAARFQQLMRLANETEKKVARATTGGKSNLNTLDELKKAKELFDSGVIPEDIYLTTREKLLNDLSAKEAQIEPEITHNVQIDRANRQGAGEGKTVLYIDGQKRDDINISSNAAILLSKGHHTISFRRAAVSSKIIEIDVVSNEIYYVTFAPKILSIEVSVTKS